MKVLIFEYITGGGFCTEDLPASLAREGGLMLSALLADFSHLAKHEVVLLQDARCVANFATHSHQVIVLTEKEDVFSIFDKAVLLCDAVWIIAPESNNILFNLTKQVDASNKLLLSSSSLAIAKCADKLQTFHVLTDHKIATIPTQCLDFYDNSYLFPLVVKPIDGVGCENSFFIQTQKEFNQVLNSIANRKNYIIQPFIKGNTLSLSAVFKQGEAQLICVNRQHLEIKNQQFKLMACEVNIAIDNKDRFQKLLNKIAQIFPDLFGYVGIDLIISDSIYVVEINPRLTSSYCGINEALGINIADWVLQSIGEKATINPACNQTVFIDIAQEKINATV